MHPGTTSQAELVWKAPSHGTFKLFESAKDNDSGGGDGVTVEGLSDGLPVWKKDIPNGGAPETYSAVQATGEFRFLTSSGANHNKSYDATAWVIDITQEN